MDKVALETEKEKENLQREYNELKKKQELYVTVTNKINVPEFIW